MPQLLRILLVEDNEGDALLVQEHLATTSVVFDIEHAVRLADARRLLADDSFDLVLLDLSLPDSNGLDTLRGVRSSAPGTPVVVLTGQLDDELGLRAVEAGAQDYLIKDEVSGRALVRAIRFAVKRARSVAETQRFQQQYAVWIQQSGDGLWEWDLTANRVIYSPGWSAALRLDGATIGDRPDAWFDRVHRDDASALANLIDEHLVGDDPTFRSEHRLRGGDGVWRWYEVRGIALRDASGQALRVTGSLRDLTEKRRGRCVSCAEVNDPRAAICHRCGAPLGRNVPGDATDDLGHWGPGDLVDDRYRIKRLLAVGSSATVYEALDTENDCSVALKVLHRWLRDDEHVMHRFLAESRVQRTLESRHVVRVYDVLVSESFAVSIMEFVRGATLREWLLSSDAAGEPGPVIDLMIPLIEAIALVHDTGVVHRDIKPENILVARGPGGAPLAKISDFGIARHPDSQARTRSGAAIGTLHYMAPEQFSDAHEVDHRADIYALGCTLFETLTRRVPFDDASDFRVMTAHLTAERPSARALNPLVSPELDAIVRRAFATAPEDRFPSAQALADALRSVD